MVWNNQGNSSIYSAFLVQELHSVLQQPSTKHTALSWHYSCVHALR